MTAGAAPGDPRIRAIAPPLYLFPSAIGGIQGGFTSVTLGYVLSHRGFSVAAIAELVALNLLPYTWGVLFGPLLDLMLTPRRWFLLSALGVALCLGLFAVIDLDPHSQPIIAALALAMGLFSSLRSVAVMAAIAVASPSEVRGRIAGWSQAGNLGGAGVGGGLGLWLATHVGMTTAASTLAAVCLVCAWPMLLIRTPRVGVGHRFPILIRALGRDALALVNTRRGFLTAVVVTLPMGQGAFLGLLPSVAGDWGASADLTATTTGLLAGLISVPGCLIGGYLCDRFAAPTVLAWSGVACALGEIAMVLGPRTSAAFVVFALADNLLLGVAFAAVSGVIYVGLKGLSGGTMGSLLGSLCNSPLVAVVALLGAVAAPYGSNGMMWTEAGLGLASAAVYGGLAWLWRPRTIGTLAPA